MSAKEKKRERKKFEKVEKREMVKWTSCADGMLLLGALFLSYFPTLVWSKPHRLGIAHSFKGSPHPSISTGHCSVSNPSLPLLKQTTLYISCISCTTRLPPEDSAVRKGKWNLCSSLTPVRRDLLMRRYVLTSTFLPSVISSFLLVASIWVYTGATNGNKSKSKADNCRNT